MKILFIHHAFAGQFHNIIRQLVKDEKNDIIFLSDKTVGKAMGSLGEEIPGVKKYYFEVKAPESQNIHPYLQRFEKDIYHGQAVFEDCEELKKEGITPDLIYCHSGFGAGLFVKEAYPNVPFLSYSEACFRDFFDKKLFNPSEKLYSELSPFYRIFNANHLLALESCDHAVSATEWQKRLHPEDLQDKISVLHDGVDTEFIQPLDKGEIELDLPNGKITKDHEVITYSTRDFEPYRGFETFIKAIEIVLKERPNVQVIILGSKLGKGYLGNGGPEYKEKVLKEVTIDESRVHFLGVQTYPKYINLLRYSDVHVYLTVPFVLSWSVLEAMAAECLVIGSKVPPVEEIITHKENGLLADFFSPEEVAEQINYAFDNRKELEKLKKASRKTIVDKYSLNHLMPKHLELMKKVIKNYSN